MEIRVLRYFLEAAREENITKAAAYLHISQPTLSKQLKDLEQELGKKLFVRSNYSIKLTDEGMLLRKRAEDILEMVDKTTDEFKSLGKVTGGDVYIGCAESHLVKHLAQVIMDLGRFFLGFFLSKKAELITNSTFFYFTWFARSSCAFLLDSSFSFIHLS